jgi:hypothetical protein
LLAQDLWIEIILGVVSLLFLAVYFSFFRVFIPWRTNKLYFCEPIRAVILALVFEAC